MTMLRPNVKPPSQNQYILRMTIGTRGLHRTPEGPWKPRLSLRSPHKPIGRTDCFANSVWKMGSPYKENGNQFLGNTTYKDKLEVD